MTTTNPEAKGVPHLRWTSLEDSARAYFSATPLQRIYIIRMGVPAKFVAVITQRMRIPKDTLYSSLNLARATIDRKVQNEQLLNQDESERVLAIAKLIGQADTIVRESGVTEDFNPSQWVAAWLQRPHPALNGKRPAELMDTGDGRELVADLLAKQQSSVYT
jgi:putative toxin-antitoxin system antitoxin component (TIGR02293 family)